MTSARRTAHSPWQQEVDGEVGQECRFTISQHLLELDDAALAKVDVVAANNTRAIEQVEEVEVEDRERADVRQGGETAEETRGIAGLARSL